MATQTNSSITHERRIAVRQGLQAANGSGWLAGFDKLFLKELGDWFATRRWLWQSLIWLSLVNGFTAFMLYLLPTLDQAGMEASGDQPLEIVALSMFFSTITSAGAIAMVILVQDEIIQEKQSGTAAWILSKPVARPAFILSKWLANVIGALIFMVVLPGVITLVEMSLAGLPLPGSLPFLAGAAVTGLTLIFYASLVILLGVLFEQRGPLLGLAFGVMLGGMVAGSFIPQVNYFLPLNMGEIALHLSMGQPQPEIAIWQIITTAVWSIVFVALATWRFQKAEL